MLEQTWRRRAETPFPLDDLRMVYAGACHSRSSARSPSTRPLVRRSIPPAMLHPHPELERIAVVGRNVGENDFWIRILNQGTSI